jgi:hypothetical protein
MASSSSVACGATAGTIGLQQDESPRRHAGRGFGLGFLESLRREAYVAYDDHDGGSYDTSAKETHCARSWIRRWRLSSSSCLLELVVDDDPDGWAPSGSARARG